MDETTKKLMQNIQQIGVNPLEPEETKIAAPATFASIGATYSDEKPEKADSSDAGTSPIPGIQSHNYKSKTPVIQRKKPSASGQA